MGELSSKPLIFVTPLSADLIGLKDSIEAEQAERDEYEIKKKNGKLTEEEEEEKEWVYELIEIFEVDDLNELAQLIPTLGQALYLVSQAKKCAMMLQQNKKSLKKLGFKTLLLTPQEIPSETLDKFRKLGLTDSMVEPVPLKSLQYKINFVLKSIRIDKTAEEEKGKFTVKFSENDSKEGKIMQDEIVHVQKKQDIVFDWQENDDGVDDKRKKGEVEAGEESYWQKEKKKEETINFADDDFKKKKEKNIFEDEAESDHITVFEKKQNVLFEETEDLNSKFKVESKIEFEEEVAPKKKKDSILYEEEEVTKVKDHREEVEFEEENTPKKKKKSENLFEREEDVKKKQIDDVEIEMEDKKKKEYKDLEMDDIVDNVKADIAEDDKLYLEEMMKVKQKEEMVGLEILEGKDKNKKKMETIEIEMVKKQKGDGGLQIVKAEKKRKKIDAKADEIDKYLRGKEEAKVEDIEIDLPHLKKKAEVEFKEEEEDAVEKKKKEDSEEDLLETDGKIKVDMDGGSDIDDDLYGRKNKKKKEDEEEELELKKSAKVEMEQVDLEEDNLFSLKKKKSDDEEEENQKNSKIKITSTESSLKDKLTAVENKIYGRMVSHLKVEDNQKGEWKVKRVDAHADHISTHYSSKQSTSHKGDNWEKKEKEGQVDILDLSKKKKKMEEVELNMDMFSKDLGEQTIDYRLLKKEFDAIRIDRLTGKPKVENPDLGGGKQSIKLVKKTVTNKDGTTQEILFEKLVYEDEEEDKQIFKADPRGMDLAVKVLSFYYKPDVKDSDIFKFISNSIFQNQKGLVAFFLYDNKTNHSLEKYVGHLLEDSGNPADILEEDWKELKNDNLKRWRETTLPTWSDETFQETEIEFIYPYFESTNNMGFAVVTFEDGLEEKYSKQVEILLESGRGIYLSNYHASNAESDYGREAARQSALEKEQAAKKGGLGGFFKRKKVG